MKLTTTFLTYHRSGEDLHLRTENQIIFISKTLPELIAVAKGLQRGQKISVEGEQEMSSTISNLVIKAEKLEVL